MSGFFTSLGHNLRRLPANVRRGLRPLPPRAEDARVRMRRAFVYHIHPRTVSERALAPATTLGLGVAAATLFAALGVTGVLLMIYYVPTPEGAHASMLDLQHAVTFGPFVRALHRWAAHGMVLVVGLHLLRVVAQAAYRGRELNWLLGLGLLAATLGLAFTGYLLPWDNRSYWAVTVSANLLDHVPALGAWLKELFIGGRVVGQPTLLRFYLLHVALLPAGMLLLVALHLWRIRRDGGLARDPERVPAGAELPAWPHLVLREGILVLLLLAAFAAAAELIAAPLGAAPDPHHPANPEKAPWYFLWLQEMVSYSAAVGGVIYPLAGSLLLLLLPWLDRERAAVGRWFGPRPVRWTAAASTLVAAGGFVLFAALAIGGWQAAVAADWRADLLNPASGMLLLALLAFWLGGWASGSTRAACLGALLVLGVGVLGCMLLGLCRGPDWAFYWPWEAWPGVD